MELKAGGISATTQHAAGGAIVQLALRARNASRTVLRHDPTAGHNLNDPRCGGGGGAFGLCYAVKNEHYPADVWRYTWSITTPMPLRDGYGAKRDGSGYLLHAGGKPIVRVGYDYDADGHKVVQRIGLELLVGGYVKEPKVVVNGLLGYTKVEVLRAGTPTVGDMARYPNPQQRTFQIGDLRRIGVHLSGSSPPLTITATGLDVWADAAERAEQLVAEPGPRYCLSPQGSLKRQWEAARFADADGKLALMFHAWEGGNGQPDCLSTYRWCQPGSYATTIMYQPG